MDMPMTLLSLCGAPAGCFSPSEAPQQAAAAGTLACPGLPSYYMSCAPYPARPWPEMCCDGRYSEALKSMCDSPLSAPAGVCLNASAPVEEVRVPASCAAGSESLCSCSELLAKHLIKSFDDCTQEAAIAACQSGACRH